MNEAGSGRCCHVNWAGTGGATMTRIGRDLQRENSHIDSTVFGDIVFFD